MSTTSGTRATPSSSRSTDTDMTDAGTTNHNVMNVNKPDLYHGDRGKLDDWLLQWDLFFMFQGDKVPAEKRVTLVASYMRGNAFKWIKPFLQQFSKDEAPDEVDEWMKDFDQFKDRIKPIFGVSNEPTIARRDIQRIRQTKSAADYAAEFQQLAANTDWDDTALTTMFRQGLKPKVKEELMRTGASTDTLDDLINTAIDIDVKLYELQQELREDPRARVAIEKRPPPRNPWRNNLSNRGNRGGRYQPNVGRRTHNNTQSGYYGPEAMDLSNLNKGPNERKNKGSYGKNKSSLTCYNCGKQGHFARDCRMKNKVIRQLNVLSSDTKDGDADASDWEIITDDLGRLMEDPQSGSEGDFAHMDIRESYDRAPTPYQELDPPAERQINDQDRYHAVECRYENGRVILGKRYCGELVRQGDKWFTTEGKELCVLDRQLSPTIQRLQDWDKEINGPPHLKFQNQLCANYFKRKKENPGATRHPNERYASREDIAKFE